MTDNTSSLIYDWNIQDNPSEKQSRFSTTFYCETLRDGIQSPSVTDPTIDEKKHLLELADAIGIHHIDIGLPGAGKRATSDCVMLAKHAKDHNLSIQLGCAARTHVNDIEAVIEVSQQAGIAIEIMAFIGSSPIRHYTENWDMDIMIERTQTAIALGVKNNLPVTYVTEDTTRSDPEMLSTLFEHAINTGAHRLCVCDTVGHSTPQGVSKLLTWTRDFLDNKGYHHIGIDWHGHNDRGLGVINSIVAIDSGADRCHGTALGIGERVGNAALDQILVNLYLLGKLPSGYDLSKLTTWCHATSQATNIDIHPQYPLVGSDAFRTATGVHASAIIKAEKKGEQWLADRIYSGVPAETFGLHQIIEIGHYSGESNVVYWLEKHGYDIDPSLVTALLDHAKKGSRVLSNHEIETLIEQHNKPS